MTNLKTEDRKNNNFEQQVEAMKKDTKFQNLINEIIHSRFSSVQDAEKCDYTAKVDVENAEDLQNFLEKLNQIPEFEKLTSDQKLRIACCYPVEMKVTDVKKAEDEQLNVGDIEFEVGCGGDLMAGDSSLVERTLKAISKAVKNYPHANIKVRFTCG